MYVFSNQKKTDSCFINVNVFVIITKKKRETEGKKSREKSNEYWQ